MGDIYHEEIVQGGTAYLAGSDSVPFISLTHLMEQQTLEELNFLKIVMEHLAIQKYCMMRMIMVHKENPLDLEI